MSIDTANTLISPAPTTYYMEHTMFAKDHAQGMGLIEYGEDGQDYFDGHPIITRDTFPLENGSVDIRSWPAGVEIVSVDTQEHTDGYNHLENILTDKLEPTFDAGQQPTELEVLRAIFETVNDSLEYDLDYTTELAEYAKENMNSIVNLGFYVAMGKGVCRHMALASAWLGTRAYEDNLLAGRMSVDVNQREYANKADAHEWTRYTATDGTIYILDSAGRYFGTLQDSVEHSDWNYFRPDEKDEYMSNNAATLLMQHI